MNGILATAASLTGKELFKKTVSEAYEYCRTKMGDKLNQWATERQIETLFKHIWQVRKVKTIWQVDKAVDLLAFYCDSHVTVGQKRKKIRTLKDFGIDGNILIQGIAGQGKSILLRYICINELNNGQYIPLFIELRKVSTESPLIKRIEIAFVSLGLKVSDGLFKHLADSGRILLLLDAFDEIPDEIKSNVITEIEDLACVYQNLKIILTSRPYQHIQMSNHFNVVTLDNLKQNEYMNVIRKLAGGQAWAGKLIDHIETKATHIKELLCTPLMVTLLILSYKSYQKLPSRLSEFYDNMFQTLLQRHDGTKPGFTRQRSCALDDHQYRQAFESLCILAKKRRMQSFTQMQMYEVAKSAIEHCGFHISPLSFVNDIVRITCLINKDGEEYRFIHKTVQEYYTASYISKKPSIWASDFYTRMLESDSCFEWNQELDFLSEIDTYRFNKDYWYPAVKRIFAHTNVDFDQDLMVITDEQLAEIFRNSFIWYEEGDNISWFVEHELCRIRAHLNWMFMRKLELDDIVADLLNNKEGLNAFIENSKFESMDFSDGEYDGLEVSAGDLIRCCSYPEINDIARDDVYELFRRAKFIKRNILMSEDKSLLDGLV